MTGPNLGSSPLFSSVLCIGLLLSGLAWRGGEPKQHDMVMSGQMPTCVMPVDGRGGAQHGWEGLELDIEDLSLGSLGSLCSCMFSPYAFCLLFTWDDSVLFYF